MARTFTKNKKRIYNQPKSNIVQWLEGELESIGFSFRFSIYSIIWQKMFTKIIVDCSCQSKSNDFL